MCGNLQLKFQTQRMKATNLWRTIFFAQQMIASKGFLHSTRCPLGRIRSQVRLFSAQDGTQLSNIIMTQGVVRPGYGRGSKTLGFPTANLPDFDSELREHLVNRGVYYGWASIQGENGLYPCVSNIGISPTFVGEENAGNIVEAYILDRPRGRGDFYGSYIRLALVGYIRPEIKFNNIGELLRRIKEDVTFTKAACASVSSASNVEANLPARNDMLIEDQAASELATLRTLYTSCVKPFLETSDSAFQASHPELSLQSRVIQAARNQNQIAGSLSAQDTAVADNSHSQPFQFLCAINVNAILSQA